MPVLTEPVHAGEFIVSEGNNSISRDCVALAANLTLLPGTVLAVATVSGLYAPLDPEADDGLQVAAAVLWDHVTTDSSGGEAVIIARMAEVHQDLLIWPDGITDEQKATAIEALLAKDIVLRQGESV